MLLYHESGSIFQVVNAFQPRNADFSHLSYFFQTSPLKYAIKDQAEALHIKELLKLAHSPLSVGRGTGILLTDPSFLLRYTREKIIITESSNPILFLNPRREFQRLWESQ